MDLKATTVTKPTTAKSSKRRKMVLSIAGGTIAVAGTVAIVLGMRGPSIPKPDAPTEKVVAFIATDTFADMPADQQKVYTDRLSGQGFEALRDAGQGLTDEQRRAAFQNYREAQEGQRTAEFFALAPGADRDAYLDKMIDEMQARMAQMANRTGGGGGRPAANGGQRANGGGGGGGGGPSRAERMKSHIEHGNSTVRAQRSAFRDAMVARMKERGITMPTRGGRGGGHH